MISTAVLFMLLICHPTANSFYMRTLPTIPTPYGTFNIMYIPHIYSKTPFGLKVPEHTILDVTIPAPYLWNSLIPRSSYPYLPNTNFPAGGYSPSKEVIVVPGQTYITNNIIFNNFFPTPFPLLSPVRSKEYLQRDGKQENREIIYKQSSSKDEKLPLGTMLIEEVDNPGTQSTIATDTHTSEEQLHYNANQPSKYTHTDNSQYY